jgi:tRNA-dihydrouridine synthase
MPGGGGGNGSAAPLSKRKAKRALKRQRRKLMKSESGSGRGNKQTHTADVPDLAPGATPESWPEVEEATAQFARMMEAAGASAITVHARFKNERPRERAHWDLVRSIAKAVTIPVLVNGSVFLPEDIPRSLARSGASGVMIARGALLNPAIFEPAARAAAETDVGGPPVDGGGGGSSSSISTSTSSSINSSISSNSGGGGGGGGAPVDDSALAEAPAAAAPSSAAAAPSPAAAAPSPAAAPAAASSSHPHHSTTRSPKGTRLKSDPAACAEYIRLSMRYDNHWQHCKYTAALMLEYEPEMRHKAIVSRNWWDLCQSVGITPEEYAALSEYPIDYERCRNEAKRKVVDPATVLAKARTDGDRD